MIDANDVDPEHSHLGEVAFRLIAGAEEVTFRIGAERPVSDALDEKFSVAFEEKFRNRANGARGSGTHSGVR